MEEQPVSRRLSGAEFVALVESGASPQQLASALLAGGVVRVKPDPAPRSSMIDTGPESLDVDGSPFAALTMLYMDGKIDHDTYTQIFDAVCKAAEDAPDAES